MKERAEGAHARRHRPKAPWEVTHLHCHDLPTRHVPHLLHHPVRTSSQLRDGLQVISFHLKILQGKKTISTKVAAACMCYARSKTPLKSRPVWHVDSPLSTLFSTRGHEARKKIMVLGAAGRINYCAVISSSEEDTPHNEHPKQGGCGKDRSIGGMVPWPPSVPPATSNCHHFQPLHPPRAATENAMAAFPFRNHLQPFIIFFSSVLLLPQTIMEISSFY